MPRHSRAECTLGGVGCCVLQGWKEGDGLGKDKQGIASHLRVKKNFENSGVGLSEARKEQQDWTLNTSSFNDVLARLNSAYGSKQKSDPASSAGKSKSSTKRKRKVTKKATADDSEDDDDHDDEEEDDDDGHRDDS